MVSLEFLSLELYLKMSVLQNTYAFYVIIHLMNKIITILSLILLFLINGCSTTDKASDKPSVVTTTYAIYDAAKHIGGSDVNVTMLIPPGREIHTFEPTPQDIVKLNKASLVIYNGEGFEPWMGQFDIGAKALDLSRYVTLKKGEDVHHHVHELHSDYDPHYWLDFDNMKRVAEVIAKKFGELEPSKKQLFMQRAKEYEKMLSKLDESYRQTLKNCKKDEIFVNHNAYGYLASRYGFDVHSLVGLSPDAEPDPKTVQNLLDEIQKEGVKYIFYEPFENSAVLNSIAKDAGVKTLPLQPLGNITADEAAKHFGYKEIMLENLHKIAQGLECNGV